MIIGYDFEIFKYNWCVVCIDPINHEVRVIWDDQKELTQYFNQHSDNIYVGYNSRHYDQYIMKSIMCGFSPYKVNNFIIKDRKPGWMFSDAFKRIKMFNYDVMPAEKSLKQLEAYQGHNIHETSVPFDIERPLTDEEKQETVKYCMNDVKETLNVFLYNKSDFDAIVALINMFNLPFSNINKTKAQVVATVLECVRTEFDDEWDLFMLPCIKLGKYENVKNWFFDPVNHWYEHGDKKNTGFSFHIAGVVHNLGFGGIHGAKNKYNCVCDPEHLIIHVDVESYYPSLMVEWDLLTRTAQKPERFAEIKEYRLKLKHEGKKKEQAPLKIVINGAYGICKDKNSSAYDPRNANLICINGQLMLVDLIDKLESVPTFELIQSNTDGLIVRIHRDYFDQLDDVCYEWETRTHMKLGFDYVSRIFQGDVNNYLFQFLESGKWERKGAYVKELSPLDNDLPIVNTAICNYFMKGILPSTTINNCSDYMQFQKIVKLSSKYEYVEHNGTRYDNKCYRVFASTRITDGAIYQVKGKRKDKYANTPDRCYIENGAVSEMMIPATLDIKWYIDLAEKRINDKWGIDVRYGKGLC